MAISNLTLNILRCIRARILKPKQISRELNVELNTVREKLDWLVFKQYITSKGKLTQKGFNIAHDGLEFFGRRRRTN